MDKDIIKAGETLLLSEGSYEDYSVGYSLIAVKEFSFSEVKKKYLEIFSGELDKPIIHIHTFKDYLFINGYVKRVKYKEIHVSDYDELTLNIYNGG